MLLVAMGGDLLAEKGTESYLTYIYLVPSRLCIQDNIGIIPAQLVSANPIRTSTCLCCIRNLSCRNKPRTPIQQTAHGKGKFLVSNLQDHLGQFCHSNRSLRRLQRTTFELKKWRSRSPVDQENGIQLVPNQRNSCLIQATARNPPAYTFRVP